jgi:type IX secretion system substrate protein
MPVRRTIVFAAILLIATIGLFAQSQTTASGGEALGSGGTVSYTVGQSVYQSNEGTGGSVTEGLQQAYEIYTVTGIENNEISLIHVSAYPNPVKHTLRLRVEKENVSDFSFQVYDIQGKLLQFRRLDGFETQIDMSNYVPSTYFLKVLSGNQSIKEFTIIKN